MKIHIQIVALVLMGMAFVSCKSRKPVVSELTSKSQYQIPVLYTEMPCGGMAPPQEIMEEMQRPKPMVNTEVFILKMEADVKSAISAKTDKDGMLNLDLDSGFYLVHLFNPATLNLQDTAATEKARCETSWKLEQRFPLAIRPSKAPGEVMVMKMCNPCEEPRP